MKLRLPLALAMFLSLVYGGAYALDELQGSGNSTTDSYQHTLSCTLASDQTIANLEVLPSSGGITLDVSSYSFTVSGTVDYISAENWTVTGPGTVSFSSINKSGGGNFNQNANVTVGTGNGILDASGGEWVLNAGYTLNVAGNGTHAMGSKISGAGNVQMAGSGTFALTSDNTGYTGNLILSSGTVSFVNNGLGSGHLIMSGGTLQWASGNTQDISAMLNTSEGTIYNLDTSDNTVNLATKLSKNDLVITKTGSGQLGIGLGFTSAATVNINEGSVRISSEASGDPRQVVLASDFVIREGAQLIVTSSLNGPSHNGKGSVTVEGGSMVFESGCDNQYFGGRYINFDVAPGNITGGSTSTPGWRLEGGSNDGLNTIFTVKAAASGSSITVGFITLTRGSNSRPVIFDVEKGANNSADDGDLLITSPITRHSSSEEVLKKGAGKLVLTSDNIGSGIPFTIAGGTLQIGNGGTTGTFASEAKMTSDDSRSSFFLNRSDDVTFSNVISGTGDFGVMGGGTFTINGANTFTGGTTVGSDTTLILASGTAMGTATFLTMGNGSALRSTDSTERNISGPLVFEGDAILGASGTGGFNFTGSELRLGGGEITFNVNTTIAATDVAGTGSFVLAGGVQLRTSAFTSNANISLAMGSQSKIVLNADNARLALQTLTLDGIATLDYSGFSDSILNIQSPMTASAGSYLIVDNYNYNGTLNFISYNNGLPVWAVLTDVKIQTASGLMDAMLNASGQIVVFDDDPATGSLVIRDDTYEYSQARKYIGSMAGDGVLVLTKELTFAGGADPYYGFTTQNDTATGTPGNSFTVDSLLSNGPSNLVRGLSLTGQSSDPSKVITIGNTNNSFTGDVNVQSVVLRAVADVVGAGFDSTNVTTLGTGNTIRLTTNATLIFDTARTYDGGDSGLTGTFTYANNIQMGQNNTTIRQDSGDHILTGNVTMIGAGDKIIQNTADSTTFTLSGSITAGQNSTGLVLRTLASPDSRIVLAGYGSSVTSMDIQGNIVVSGGIAATEGVRFNGGDGSLLLAGGTLSTLGTIENTSGSNSILSVSNGGVLQAIGDLVLGESVALDFASLGSGEEATFDSGSHTLTIESSGSGSRVLSGLQDGAVLQKTGSGVLVLNDAVTGSGILRISQGSVTMNGYGNSFSSLDLRPGAVLNIEGQVGFSEPVTVNGIIRGAGSIQAESLTFQGSGVYDGNMRGQAWDAVFQEGSDFRGRLSSNGDILFESGSRFTGTVALDMSDAHQPVPLDSPQLIVDGGGVVSLNGVRVSGDTTTDQRYWEQGIEYSFTLIQTETGNLRGADGQVLNEMNLSASAILDPTSWGAFLTGVLDYVEGEKLIVTVTRNERYTAEFARTSNQLAVSTGLDYAIDNYARLGLSGTEMGEVVRYFNAMGDDIAAEAPAAFDMLGGLSSYHALAGMRTDLLRHTENVRLRAQSGGKGINLNKETPENQLWVEGTQSYQKHQSSLNSPGYTVQTWGGAVGVDYLSAANYSLGISFAYSSLNITSTQYSAKSLADTYYVDLYGRWEKGPWSGTFVVTGSTNEVRMKRDVILDDQYYNVTGRPSGRQVLGMAEVAYAIPVNEKGLYFEPAVGMWIGQTRLDSYTEKGFGNAGLEVSQQKMSIAQGVLGVRLYEQRIDPVFGHESLRWEVRTSVSQEFGDDEYHTVSRFIGAPQDFTTRGNSVGKTSFQVGGSVSVALDNRWSVFADAGGEFRKDVKGMTSALGLRCTF